MSEDILQAENYIKTRQTNINKIITLASNDKRLMIKRRLTSSWLTRKRESSLADGANSRGRAQGQKRHTIEIRPTALEFYPQEPN